MLITTGDAISGVTTRAYSDDGTPLWTVDFGASTTCVVIDSNGDVIVGGTGGIKKYNGDGDLIWDLLTIGNVSGVATDSAGNIYTVGPVYSSYTTRKFDSSGSLIWRVNHGIEVNAVAVDSSGNVYTGGNLSGGYTTRKYNSSGTPQWGVNDDFIVYGIAVRGDLVVTVGQYYSFGQTIRTYDLSGTFGWGTGYGATIYGVVIDSQGAIFTAGNGVSSYSIALRKFSASGTLLWTALTNYVERAIAIDSSDNIYICGDLKSSTITTLKYDSSNTQQYTLNHEATCRGVAWILPPVKTELPGLPLQFLLDIPFTAFVVTVPAIEITHALAAPSVTSPPLPPELAGLPVARVYRAWLSGGAELLELPMASFQCVRRTGESTWLAVTLPTYSAGLAATLYARIGGEIVINAGYRLADGSETLGLFLRATVTAVDMERTRYGASITLTARVIPTSSAPQTRVLAGIQQQQVTVDGRHSVICEADPLLRPGDTVTAIGASFVVGAIRYAIRPQDAVMELTEAL